MNLTDNEIVKTLSICSNKTIPAPCPAECPMFQYDGDCFDLVQKDMLDLINRQRAEIEFKRKKDFHDTELITSLRNAIEILETRLNKAKSAAIKEFAENLKAEKTTAISCDLFEEVVRKSDIDNIVKEMVGESNG